MKIDILTLFPEMFQGFLTSSILGKSIQKNIVEINTMNFREFAPNKHHKVDDTPYGGGGGMVLKVEPIFEAVESLVHNIQEVKKQSSLSTNQTKIILLCPQGEPFTQKKAEQLASATHLIFICGHYEGYDERIRQHVVTDEISIGDYVLMGGEVPAMVVIDAVVRLLPGVLGNDQSAMQDSFSNGLLEYPQYTRPAKYRDWEVPEVLVSGNHEQLRKWRKEQSILRTFQRRPDLLASYELSISEQQWLKKEVENLNRKEKH
jgi:tRNA (guanine37-N1)-methyltransferase